MGNFYDVAVIGGGAAGILSAIEIKKANENLHVCIFEKNDRIGKKLLLTGNSKCNISNSCVSVKNYMTDDEKFLDTVLSICKTESIINTFESMGVLCKSDAEGRIYPLSEKASCVLNSLRLELQRLEIKTEVNFDVKSIKKYNGKFKITGEKLSIYAKNIVLACGGKAYPSTGSNGELLDKLHKIGLTVNPIFPALTPVKIEENKLIGIVQGVRVKGKVSLISDNNTISVRSGEIQFKKDAVSGICILDLSNYVSKFQKEKNLMISLDVFPTLDLLELEDLLRYKIKNYPFAGIENILSSVVHSRIAVLILRMLNLSPSLIGGNMSENLIHEVAYMFKNIRFNILGTYGFNESQSSIGGVSCNEIDCYTMESKKIKGLYIVGEALDVTGDCGGYNLHFAWSSAMLCGRSFS